MRQVIVFAGTTEGRQISEWLAAAGVETLCSVATEYGELLVEKQPHLSVRQGRLLPEEMEQLDLFTDLATEDARREAEQAALAREKKLQETTLAIKKKFGKNAILKGMSLEEGATARERNARIGGHKA